MGIMPLSACKGPSTPVLEPAFWMHLSTGWIWREDRIDNRGRVVLKLHTPVPGQHHYEIRLYRLVDDPGTGASLLGAPYWIRTAAPGPTTSTERTPSNA